MSKTIKLLGRGISRSMLKSRCVLVRKDAFISTSRIYPSSIARAFSTQRYDSNTAHIKERIPKEEYYQGHLMADHLEYIDGMIEKAVEMEVSINKLQEAHEKKKDLALNVNWMESYEIQALFEKSEQQKEEIREKISSLREVLNVARSRLIAVDAPDGTSDDMIQEEMQAVAEIINYTKEHEIKDAIEELHENEECCRQEAMKTFAVDSPDGTPDAHIQETLNDIKQKQQTL